MNKPLIITLYQRVNHKLSTLSNRLLMF